jgi:PadR family transcriptional regulator PadR
MQKSLDKNNTSCYDVLHEGRYSMDIQLKRGLLDACVLAAIKNEDSYGYKIIKDMKPYMEMSESTLYTILKRLELGGLLTVRVAEHGGRLRKYYRITDAGLLRLEQFKEEWREVMNVYSFVVREDLRDDEK